MVETQTPELEFAKSIRHKIVDAVQSYAQVRSASLAPGNAENGVIKFTPLGLKDLSTQAFKDASRAETLLLRNPAAGHLAKPLVVMFDQMQAYQDANNSLSQAAVTIEGLRGTANQEAGRADRQTHESFMADVELFAIGLSARPDLAGSFALARFEDDLSKNFEQAQLQGRTASYARLVSESADRAIDAISEQSQRYDGLIAQRTNLLEAIGPAKTFLVDMQSKYQQSADLDRAANAVREVWRSNLLTTNIDLGYAPAEMATMGNEDLDNVIEQVAIEAGNQLAIHEIMITPARESMGL